MLNLLRIHFTIEIFMSDLYRVCYFKCGQRKNHIDRKLYGSKFEPGNTLVREQLLQY